MNTIGRVLLLRGLGGVAAQLQDGDQVVATERLNFGIIFAQSFCIDLSSPRLFAGPTRRG